MKQHFIFLSIGALLALGASAQTYQELDANNIRAGFNSGGLNFCKLVPGSPATVTAAYEVPKGSGVHTGFGNFIWVGGYQGGNTLCVAAPSFRDNGADYFPGPYSSTNSYLSDTVNWNRVWKIRASDIQNFVNWSNNPSAYPNYTIPNNILTWPGNGNPALGQAANLAPYVDVNSDGIYSPTQGDYPCIKGQEAIYYIVNDDAGPHTFSGGNKVGIEIHCMAYTFDPNGFNAALSNVLNNTIMVNYKVFNRSPNTLGTTYVGVWDEFDLGYYADDYIGCDYMNDFYYIYNGDSYDETAGGVVGYGNYLPAQGSMFLATPEADAVDGMDNDHDGIIDEVGEQLWMSGFTPWQSNGAGVPSSRKAPTNALEHYGYLAGFWRDGATFTCDASDGYGGTTPTRFLYPHDTYPNGPCGYNDWTEGPSGNLPGDRRGVGSLGPFTFEAGEVFELELAHIWSYSGTPNDPFSSVNSLKSDAQLLRNYISLLSPTACNGLITTGISETNPIKLSIYPVPASEVLHIDCPYPIQRLEVIDVLGKTMAADNSNDQSVLNITSFPNGVYLLKVYTDRGIAVQRFIKQ